MISEVVFTSLEQWRAVFPAPSVPFLYKSAQAADAEEMQRAVEKLLIDLAALNAEILAATSDPDTLLTPSDWNLAGAGDGHTFIFTITYVAVSIKGGSDFADAIYRFATASNAESMDAAINAKLNETLSAIIPPPPADPTEAVAFWNQVVGGAKGTRLMAGVGLIVQGQG